MNCPVLPSEAALGRRPREVQFSEVSLSDSCISHCQAARLGWGLSLWHRGLQKTHSQASALGSVVELTQSCLLPKMRLKANGKQIPLETGAHLRWLS